MNIFDIERYATKDGPGIRTVLFFKGCNLRCAWCQNPESQSPKPQIMFYGNRCAACGKCVRTCPDGAITFSERFGYVTDHSKCSRCGRCVEACFYSARDMVGREYSADELMDRILADKNYYLESGGGVTFSGGEPLLYPDDVRELAAKCREEGIHTALETAASVAWNVLETIIPLIDLFYIDLKHIDPEVHKAATGIDNRLILENIKRIGANHQDVVIRIPVVPGVNHSLETISRMLDFIAGETRLGRVELLPYHRLGIGKYSGLGMPYDTGSIGNVEDSECLEYENYGRKLGLDIRTGTV